jgi:hypothetical protein
MKKMMLVVGSVLAFVSVAVLAEEFTTPVRFNSDVNFDNGAIIKIAGTKLTATAAQLNAAASGATATVTPTTCTVSNTLTAAKKFVQTSETLTLTKGTFTLTPTQNVYFVSGQYGVVTMALATASSEMAVDIINLGATNVVFAESTWTFIPTGYTEWTNGQYDVMSFRSQSTNWICTGTQDN